MVLFWLDIKDCIMNSDFESLRKEISFERNEKIERLCNEKDKIRSLYAELLVRYGASRFGLNINHIEFVYGKYGKPKLKGNENIHFNLSHSEDIIVCAFSENEIGIDIEKIAAFDEQIIEDVLMDPEKKRFYRGNEIEKKEFFFKIWTLKESFLKKIGIGLMIPLNSFGFEIIDERNIALRKFGECFDDSNYYLFNEKKGYQVAVCTSESSMGQWQYVHANQLNIFLG